MAGLDPPDFRLLPDDAFDADGPAESEVGPGLGRRGKAIAGILVAALVISGLLVQLHRAKQHPNPTGAATRPTGVVRQPWPTGPDVCGNQIRQPVITADPPSGRTGIELSIGANSLYFGNLDSGDTNPDILLIGQTFLFDRAETRTASYVELADCASGSRIGRVDATGQYRTVLDDPLSNGLLTDGAGGVWAARFTDGGATMSEAKLQVILRRLDRPAEIPLGSLMFPLTLRGRLVYAEQQVTVGAGSRLVVYDLDRRRVVNDLGPFNSAEAVDRELIWVPRACDGVHPCEVHKLDLKTDTESVLRATLPRDFQVDGAAVSPDHQRLAVAAPRRTVDPTYTTPDGSPPSAVVVLDLTSGGVSIVPDVEIPPGGHIALTFATDSRRLVLGAGAGDATKFYVWSPGQARPRSTRLTLATPLPTPGYLRAIAVG